MYSVQQQMIHCITLELKIQYSFEINYYKNVYIHTTCIVG